jgi:hypothetical protein
MGVDDVADGPEPTGWELMRGLNEIKGILAGLGQNYVPSGTYQANQESTSNTLKQLAESVAAERLERQVAVKAVVDAVDLLETSIQANKDAVEKQRKQFWLTVAGGALLLVIGIFVTPITRLLGITP